MWGELACHKRSLTHRPGSQGGASGVLLFLVCVCVCWSVCVGCGGGVGWAGFLSPLSVLYAIHMNFHVNAMSKHIVRSKVTYSPVKQFFITDDSISTIPFNIVNKLHSVQIPLG